MAWLSVIPPILAIALALWKKRVVPALLLGILSSHMVLNPGGFYLAPFKALDHIVRVVSDPGNLKLIFFSVMVGGFMKLVQVARGFEAFAEWVEKRHHTLTRKSVFSVTSLLGGSLFLEVWSNVLINSTVVGPLYDRLRISRVRMAYFIHTLGIAAVSVIPINSWAAFYMGLLRGQGIERPFEFLLNAIPYMLYSWIAMALVLFVMATGFTLGPMKRFDAEALANPSHDTADTDETEASAEPRLIYMLVPILTLILSVLVSLYLTGDGDITQGDGSSSILYAVALASASIAMLLIYHKVCSVVDLEKHFVGGMAGFFDVGILIILALSLGDLCKVMGVGTFVAQFAQGTLPIELMPALVFFLGAAMSFATGTSYGTFSILTPIAIPLALATGSDPALMFGACIAGGVWGDNCSPISDTSIVTSVGAKVAIIDHVQTQLPYALLAGGISLIGFVVLGFSLT